MIYKQKTTKYNNSEETMSEKIDFITGCPVEGCDNRYNLISWNHTGCGGEEWIDEYGYIECKKCSKKFKLIETNFQCNGNHDSKKPVNASDIIRCLSSMTLSQGINSRFAQKLMMNIINDMN